MKEEIILYVVTAVFGLIISIGFSYLFLNAIEKEQAFYNQIRVERCVSLGEKLTKEQEKQCEDL